MKNNDWEKELDKRLDKLEIGEAYLGLGVEELKDFIGREIKRTREETIRECLPKKWLQKNKEDLGSTIMNFISLGVNNCRKQFIQNAKDKYGIELK